MPYRAGRAYSPSPSWFLFRGSTPERRERPLHCQVERTFLEGQQASLARSCALDKGGDVNAFFEHTPRHGHTLLRALDTSIAVNGHKVSQLHAVAEHGNLHQRTLDKCRCAAW